LFNFLLAAGDKEDPAEVAKGMRVAGDESGKFRFLQKNGEQPSKWLVISHYLQKHNISKSTWRTTC